MNRRAALMFGAALLASLPAISLTGCSSSRYDDDVEYVDGTGSYRFSSQPRMRRIGDTDVYYIRDASDYDVYQFEGTWYLNDRGNWYRASSWRGPFGSINADVVPYEISVVPEGYRRNWVSVRRDRRDWRDRDLPSGYWASGRTFSTRPDMGRIPSSSVTYARRTQGFDLYRLHGTWYLADNSGWYRASSWRGPFLAIRLANVPGEIRTIPYRYRRSWSTTMGDYRDNDRYSANDPDRYSTIRYWSSGRTFTMEPQTYTIGNSGVYYYRGDEDYDMYRYGSAWYLIDNSGSWYRADTWRGPFISVQLGSIPRAVINVPTGYRRYWTTD